MKKEKKLRLKKIKIQNLTAALDRDEQKQARGGSADTAPTDVPVVC